MNHPANPLKGGTPMKQHRIFTWASAICAILLFFSHSLPVQANSAAVYWRGASSIGDGSSSFSLRRYDRLWGNL